MSSHFEKAGCSLFWERFSRLSWDRDFVPAPERQEIKKKKPARFYLFLRPDFSYFLCLPLHPGGNSVESLPPASLSTSSFLSSLTLVGVCRAACAVRVLTFLACAKRPVPREHSHCKGRTAAKIFKCQVKVSSYSYVHVCTR